jgi:mono/diheme cytochrome c family protein
MVAQRAESLQQGRDSWVPPTNLIQDHLRQQPVGQLFNSITHGIRNMPAYGSQIDVEERWAIILYIRALQKSRSTQLAALDSERGSLK